MNDNAQTATQSTQCSVHLIHFTGKGTRDETWYAAKLLAFTKNTRLNMTPSGFSEFFDKSIEELTEEMIYMSATIASSWEFVDLIFSINNISRACAQQMTRTRTASYAMQSQRVTDMSTVSCHIPPTVPAAQRLRYELTLSMAVSNYSRLLKDGVSREDARGVLPMNSHCNLIAKYNLRDWVNLVRSRDSLRVQGEYHDVIVKMKQQVLAVWPWAMTFIEPKLAKAIHMIEELAEKLPPEHKMQAAKAADLLKKETA